MHRTPGVSGQYEVYAKWTAHANRATDAKYTVNHASGATQVTVNQQLSGGTFNLLGTFNLTAGSTIALTDQANGYVIADAIQLISVGPAPQVMYFIHTDHLNTPRLITNNVGQAVWRFDNNDPFGGNLPDENPSGLGTFTYNPRLPGTYADQETGLLYNWWRTLDTTIGRYIQSDPLDVTTIGEPTSTTGLNHPYAYVENNPLSYFDPWGLCRVEVRFKPVPGAGSMGIYHAYIITTAPNGSQTYFRGGPTGRPTPSQPIWGNITTRYGAYGPNTPDWDPGNPPSVVLRDDNESCECFDASFTNTLNTIKAANISYIPLRRNSNSVVGTALTNAGFGSFTPPVTAPALWNNLNRWKPQ